MAFEMDWETTDGRFGTYRNFSGKLIQDTLLMDLKREPMIDPATIRIRGQRVPAKLYLVKPDGEEVELV